MSKPIAHCHPRNYRSDIDGLRALAILLVITFHAFPKFLRGGFIGVDIFFVISGYLITGIIINGQSQGDFSLLEFYSRRIKRIFPALIVVLIFCLVAGWYGLLADEYEALGKHIAAGSIYISNFVLKNEAGYFDTQAEYKPLLHLWSLSIEEQFYLVFPLLLMVSLRLTIKPVYIILICLVLSFSFNITQIDNNSTEVFFYPSTRAWELLIGSFVACAGIYFSNPTTQAFKIKLLFNGDSKKSANLIAWIGILSIISAWYFFDSKKILFPSWWALIPTMGTACLIIAGESAWFNKYILASKIAVYIGLISYPLYLWHWVLLSLINITEIETPKPLIKLIILLVSIIFAWATYFFVEKNIRFHKNNKISLYLFIILASIGSLGVIVQQQKGYPNRFKDYTSHNAQSTYNIDIATKNEVLFKECQAKFPNADFCLIQDNNSLPTALLVGDSHAHHLYYGLIRHKALTGGNLLSLAVGDCFPFFDNPNYPNDKCRPLINQALNLAISNPSVKTIILAGRALTEINEQSFIPKRQLPFYPDINSEAAIEIDPYILFKNGMKNTLQRLIKTNKTIIFVLDTPDLEFKPTVCIKRPWRLGGQVTKSPCAIARSQVDNRRYKYLTMVTKVLNEFPNVKVWDTLPALCDLDYCWAIKKGQILYQDAHHLNSAGAVYLGEHFALVQPSL